MSLRHVFGKNKIQNKLHNMKNKIAIASAFVAASSLATAEIVINDFLSFEGFVDMSYQYTDFDSDTAAVEDGSDNSFAVDQVEIDWLFDFDPITAQIDVAFVGSDAAGSRSFDVVDGSGVATGDSVSVDDEVVVEQAFVTYSFEDGLAITAGRMASMLGFEAFEPTGLYQFSFAYDQGILPGYAQGVKVSYETEDMFFAGSLLDGYADEDGYSGRLGGSGDSNYALELAASFLFGDSDEFGWFIGGYYEDGENDDVALDGSVYVINTYLTYESGAWIFAGEVNFGNSEVNSYGYGGDDTDALSGLIMANYAYSDAASVTGRVSYEDFDGDADGDQYKLTLAHGYAFTDNLSLITEISYVDGENASEDFDGIASAIELLFAF